jgi:hypothetical protein
LSFPSGSSDLIFFFPALFSLPFSNPGSTFCFQCNPGSFFVAATATCQVCDRGYYADKPGQGACSPCPDRFFTNKTGQG